MLASVRRTGLIMALLAAFGVRTPASAEVTGLFDRQPSGPAFDCKAASLSRTEKAVCSHANSPHSISFTMAGA